MYVLKTFNTITHETIDLHIVSPNKKLIKMNVFKVSFYANKKSGVLFLLQPTIRDEILHSIVSFSLNNKISCLSQKILKFLHSFKKTIGLSMVSNAPLY